MTVVYCSIIDVMFATPIDRFVRTDAANFFMRMCCALYVLIMNIHIYKVHYMKMFEDI